MATHFQREMLPDARSFYEGEQLGRMGRASSKGWIMCRCPFHSSKSGRSFSISIPISKNHEPGTKTHPNPPLQGGNL